ncbi:hypothetical protein DUI87_10578 [Hirundo rustica rustica]|uniref:Uncharacterized protein n=1 Tax=Hirundo rustica rustica TaxID=333673 RepID=A0A3M0KIH9_HIRRU|nr:hypothetical protein DUI87_10578 [Hirundo rustica rustica]
MGGRGSFSSGEHCRRPAQVQHEHMRDGHNGDPTLSSKIARKHLNRGTQQKQKGKPFSTKKEGIRETEEQARRMSQKLGSVMIFNLHIINDRRDPLIPLILAGIRNHTSTMSNYLLQRDISRDISDISDIGQSRAGHANLCDVSTTNKAISIDVRAEASSSETKSLFRSYDKKEKGSEAQTDPSCRMCSLANV